MRNVQELVDAFYQEENEEVGNTYVAELETTERIGEAILYAMKTRSATGAVILLHEIKNQYA